MSGTILNKIEKKPRESNLELYRIIVMLLIVAHHYVVNSGLTDVLKENPGLPSASVMLLFGAWGKTGINCFLLITGYFMCRMDFSWNKLIKLYLQILFYAMAIYAIFLITGHESFSLSLTFWKIVPLKHITDGFISCFLLFYLFIPILNILIRHLDRISHLYLVILLFSVYTLLPSVGVRLEFSYIGWFAALYIMASYIRLYSRDWNITHRQWGNLSIISIALGSLSILSLEYLHARGFIGTYDPYFFVSDSNKIFAVLIAVTTFMWFKDLKISYNPLINMVGAATFGVLLIHANSAAMRRWLWMEVVDAVGNFQESVASTLLYASGTVIVIFMVCAVIEILRARFLEPHIIKGISQMTNRLKYGKKSVNVGT